GWKSWRTYYFELLRQSNIREISIYRYDPNNTNSSYKTISIIPDSTTLYTLIQEIIGISEWRLYRYSLDYFIEFKYQSDDTSYVIRVNKGQVYAIKDVSYINWDMVNSAILYYNYDILLNPVRYLEWKMSSLLVPKWILDKPLFTLNDVIYGFTPLKENEE